MLKQRIDNDLKSAMLKGDKSLVMILRNLKSSILYAEVASNSRDKGLDEEAIIITLRKEAKKRQESADLYAKAGNLDRQKEELKEKSVIEQYLPQQLSEEEVVVLVDKIIKDADEPNSRNMGYIIKGVKEICKGAVDGSMVAKIVKEKLQ